MEVYKWKDRKLLLKILTSLWNEDKDLFYAFKESLIVLPVGQEVDLVVLPGSAEEAFLSELETKEKEGEQSEQ
jgi:hypothetical protein